MRTVPRVASVQDLSGFGRCSLTVVLPLISAMGVQVCPLPTAVLSTHSGGFGPFHFTDLTDSVGATIAHWKQLNLEFDCIFSGFLGSAEQIALVLQMIHNARQRTEPPLVVIDPVMGDHGRLYQTYTPEMQQGMTVLVHQADVITPNLTEACFLLGEPYIEVFSDVDAMEDMVRRLSELGPKQVILTGAALNNSDQRWNLAYDGHLDQCFKIAYTHLPAHYPGTGDAFASVVVGALLTGATLNTAVERATSYVSYTVGETLKLGTPEREGIAFELTLGVLIGNEHI